MKILGLTGGIASGKSSVSEFLRKRNGYIFDADKIAHSVMMKGKPAYPEILSEITGEYLHANGQIDRKKLGAIVFSDRKKLKTLETIVHKHTIHEITEGIDNISTKTGAWKFIVIDAPLLIESGLCDMCDEVWVVQAERDVRIERLMARNGLTKAEADNRINIQTDWDNLQSNQYVFINNNGRFKELFDETDKKLEAFLE